MFRLRDLQDETGGFTAFITWSYQPEHTELAGRRPPASNTCARSPSRGSCSTTSTTCRRRGSPRAARWGSSASRFGANDMGSVMIEENVVRAAGAAYCMDEVEIVRNIEDAGFSPKRRNMHYEILGDPISASTTCLA